MTWKDLLEKLAMMNDEDLKTDVTIHLEDEFYKVNGDLMVHPETDVLDEGHLFLEVDESICGSSPPIPTNRR